MITVIAGVNGAGKSSIVGSYLRRQGGEFFNPDEVTRHLLENNPSLSLSEANGHAWQLGYEQLKRAVDENKDYTFETTLGGNSICQALHQAIDNGVDVRIFFVGLVSPELHLQRVAERVLRGGHNIPEEKIRERWRNSIRNMLGLIPRCQAVRVFDNTKPADKNGPKPICLFSISNGTLEEGPIHNMPEWAKSLAAVALKCTSKS